MKKFWKVFVTLFVAFSLVACGKPADKPAAGDDGEKTKVALIVGMLGDLSFNDSAEEGLKKAEKDFNLDLHVIEYGEDPAKIETTLVDTAEEGFDIIIGPSQFGDTYEENASNYPDTTFILFDAAVDYENADVKNVYSIVYSANEASYAAGYLAAKHSETGVIGFLGGEEAPVINDFLLGYIEGAILANPDIKVASSFVGNWSDSAKGKELSLAMINQKADIIFGAAGGATMGIFEAGVEKDIKAIGVDFDQALVFEKEGKQDFADITISSVMKNVGDSLYRAIELYSKDELKIGEEEVLGIKENGVGLADNDYYKENVSEEVQKDVAEIIEKIGSGDVKVTSYYDSPEELEKLKESVRP